MRRERKQGGGRASAETGQKGRKGHRLCPWRGPSERVTSEPRPDEGGGDGGRAETTDR